MGGYMGIGHHMCGPVACSCLTSFSLTSSTCSTHAFAFWAAHGPGKQLALLIPFWALDSRILLWVHSHTASYENIY